MWHFTYRMLRIIWTIPISTSMHDAQCTTEYSLYLLSIYYYLFGSTWSTFVVFQIIYNNINNFAFIVVINFHIHFNFFFKTQPKSKGKRQNQLLLATKSLLLLLEWQPYSKNISSTNKYYDACVHVLYFVFSLSLLAN